MQPVEETLAPRRQRLTAGDARLVALAAVVIAVSSLYVFHNYRAAFPQASLNLKLSRGEITRRAAAFLEARQFETGAYRNLTLFAPDDEARLFLERQVGLTEANRLMSAGVVVWQWRARWYRPPSEEEFRVWLTPEGGVTGFDHHVAEAAPGARLTLDQARAVARPLAPAAGYHLVEERTEARPNRNDHVFEWERDGFAVHGATYRRVVAVRGAAIGGFHEYLKVPDEWRREFGAMRSRNELYARVAQGFFLVLALAAVVVLLRAQRAGQTRWRAIVKVSGAVAVLAALNQWNNLPFALDGLPTSTRWETALPFILLQGAGVGAVIFLYVSLAAASGETLYRRYLPGRLSLTAMIAGKGIETREFFRASVVGYAMAAGHIACLTAFYLIGRRFGVWSPQDVAYSDLLSTALPWLYPLAMALVAAVGEEAWFRLLAIPLLARRGRLSWLALVAPAVVWGFLHANYPQQPPWIRGVEVGVIGVVAGAMMWRFGIWATLVWHYTVDAVLMGSFLYQTQDWYLRAAALLVAGLALAPLAVSGYRYRIRGGFLTGRHLLNAADPPPADDVEQQRIPALMPAARAILSPRLLVAVAIALGLGALLARPRPYGDFIRIHVARGEALRIVGAPPPGWRQAIEFATNLPVDELEYVRRMGGDPNAVLRTKMTPAVWRVRHFQPLNKQERWLYLSPGGRVIRTDLILDDDAPGANLEQVPARALAERYLRDQGVEPARYELVEAASEKLKSRTDHAFTWEETDWRTGDARARLSLAIRGDQPSEFRRYLKLPEAWERDFGRLRLVRYLLAAVVGGIALALMGVLLRNLRHHVFRWRRYAVTGVLAGLLTLAGALNGWPGVWSMYNTAQPPGVFLGNVTVSLLARSLLVGLGAAVAMLALEVFGGARRLGNGPWFVAPAMAVAFGGAARLIAWGMGYVPGERFTLPVWPAPPADAWSPALAVLVGAAKAGLLAGLVGAILAAAAAWWCTRRQRLAFGFVVAVSFALGQAGSILLICYMVVAVLLMLGLASLVVRTAGGAAAQWMAAVFGWQMASGAYALLQQPNSSLQRQGWLALGAGVTLVALWLWWQRRRTDTPL